jgi:hypothetical protein
MDCARINAWLDQGRVRPGPGSDAAVEQHLRQCERCRNLVQALEAEESTAAPSAETLSRIQAALAAGLAPVRPLARPGALALGLAIVFVALSGSLVLATGGVRSYGVMTSLQLASLSGLALGGACLLVFSLASQIIPGSRVRFPAAPLVVLFVAATGVGAALLFRWESRENFFPLGIRCLVAGSVVAALVAVFSWLVVRRGVVGSKPLFGATLGVFVGLAGLFYLHLHCFWISAWHIFFWHTSVPALWALAGLLAGILVQRRASSRAG